MTSLVELFTFRHENSNWGAPEICFFLVFTNSIKYRLEKAFLLKFKPFEIFET